MAFDFINKAIDKMVGIGVGKAKNAISDIANDTTTAVKNVGSSIVDTAKEANYQFGKSISENLVEPIKANLADKGVDLTKPAEGTTFQQAVEYAKRVPIAGTAIFDQFAIKNPTKVIGQAVDLYSDYRDDNQLNASSKIGAKTGDIIQTFGENVGFQKPVTSAGDVFNAGEALINSETKAQVIDNGLKVGNSLFQTVMNARKVANVVGGAFQTGMKETGSDVAVEKVTKQGAGMLSDSLQSVGVEKNDADSLGRTLIDTIITVVSLGGYAKGSSKVGGYKKVASNMAQEDLKAALKTKTIPKSDATSFLLSRTKEIESNLRPVDVMKYNAGKILTDVKYQSAVPTITAIIDGVQNGFDEQKLKDDGKAITATAGSTIIGGVIPPIKKSKASTVDEAQTKIAIDETPTIPTIKATPSMALAKPSVQGNSKAVYTTSDPNITQIIRSSFVSNKGEAKTAPEHTNALTEAGFSPEDIIAIRDFAVNNHTKGVVDAQKAKDFIIGLKSQPKVETQTNAGGKATKTKVVETPTPTPEVDTVKQNTSNKPINIEAYISSFKLPSFADKVNPPFGKYKIDFGNDFNKALYIIRENGKKRSASDGKFLKVVMDATGLDEKSARRLGDVVYQDIYNKIYKTGEIEGNTVKVGANLFENKGSKKVAPPAKTPTPTPTPDTPINNIRSTKGSNDFVDYFQKKLGDNITKEGLLKFGFTEKQIFDNTFDSLKTESNKLGVSLEDLFEIAKKAEADKILTKPIKEAPTPTPTPTDIVPTIKATPKMAFAKPSVPGDNKAVYTTSDPNITQIIRSSFVSSKGTAPTAPEHTNALTEAGFSPEDIIAIRDFAVNNHTKGVVDAQKAKDFIIGLKNNEQPTPTKTKVVKSTNKVIAPKPSEEVTPTPTPTPLGSLTSLVETYKGDGKTKGKVGSIQVDFENPLNKVLYSIRESKNKLKPVEEKAIQELARLSGMDEAQIRKLGEDVSKQIKDKIYREKAVTPEGVKLSSAKDKVDDNINVPKEDDILGLNDTPPTPKAKKEVSPLTQRYQELIANNAKEGDKINTVKGIFDLGKTFNKVFSHLDRIASTKTLLNNFRIGDAKELVGSYIESKQARDHSQIATEGLNHFNAEGLTKDLSFKPKRELTQQDLIGSTTPNGFKLDDPNLAKEAFDTYLLDSEKFLERTVPLVAKGVASKDILQATRNSAIYNSFKNDPAKLNEFFTPEQIAIFQKLGSEVASIESTLVKSGQDIGVIPDYIDPESGYLRKVTTGRAAERAGKFKQTENDGKIEVTLADGTVMKVDNFDDALRVSQINADGHTLSPEAMSSLTKKQAGPEYDPFRLHGDYASILSLNDAIGKLYADKNALKVIDTVLEKGDPEVASAMKNKAYGLMAKDVLGIRGTQGQDVLDKTARVAGRTGVVGTMLYNVKNMGWNVVPSYARTGVRSLMDFASAVEQRTKKEGMKGFTGAFKDAKISQIMKSMRNEQVDARLRGLGAINEFNIDNASAASKLEGQLMYMSNGTWAEIPGSKLAAVLSMANSLNRAGRLEGAKDANGVIDRWEAWQKEGGQEFYESRGALDDTLRSLGKTDASDKMNLPFVPASVNGALGSLKSWSTSQAASKKEMINTIVRNAYEVATKKDRSYTDRQSEEATKDLATRTLVFLATAEVIKQSLFAQGELDENDDPDLIRDTVRSATTGVIADPLTPYLWSIYNAATSGSVALSVPANIAKGAYQLAMAGGKEIFGDEKEAQAYLRDSLASFGKIGTIRGISDTFGIFNKGDSLQDLLANKAGTFSKEEANASGVASGKDWDSASSRASKLGFVNAEQAKQDALYAMKNRLDAPDWVNKIPYGDIVFNAIKQEMRPVLDYLNDQESNKSTPGDILDKSVRAGYAYDVVKDLKNSKDTNDFLQKNGLEGKDAMVQQLLTDLIKSNISQNKNVDEKFTQLVQGLSPNTFLQDMDKIRELDPYLYNNIVATFGELKAIRNEAGSLSPETLNNTVIDRIKNKTNSISQEDYAISQANDDYALTTSFTNAIGNEIANVKKDLGKSNPKEAKEKLDKLEKLSAVMNSPSIYSYKIPFANLVANNAKNLLQVFTDLKADNNSYPFLKNAMLFGAQVVRGAKEGQPEKPPVTPTPPTPPPPTPLSGTTLRSLIGSRPAVTIDKPAVVSNITIDKPLKVGSSKVGQTLVKLPMSEGKQNTQTLSSMVKRKSPKL